MIVAVTGHRPPKLGGYRIPNPVYDAVVEQLRTELRAMNPELVLIGMALGVDQWAAEVCIDEDIPWDAIIPFHGYESQWPQESKHHYELLKAQARHVHVVTNTHQYNSNLLYRRNAWMVDHSGTLLAVWNGRASGTGNCVEYAYRRNKPVRLVRLEQPIWDLAQRIEEEENRRRAARQLGINPLGVLRGQEGPVGPFRRPDAPATPRPLATISEQALPAELRERLAGFVGQPQTPEVLQRLQAEIQRIVTELQGRDIIPEQTEPEPDIVDELTVGVDIASGEDRTVVQVVQQTTTEPEKEVAPRFRPGRRIIIDEE